MKLEDLTKEELIWLIQNRCFCSLNDFEFDILMHRSDEINKASNDEFTQANDALGEYVELVKPYYGKPLSAIPDDVIHKATEKMKARESHLKKFDRLEKQYRKISRRTEQILGIKEARDG